MTGKPTYEELEQRVRELERLESERKRTEEALLEKEAQYRPLTENMTDILWTADLGMNTTYVSPSIERVLGFTVEERLKQSLHEQMPPETLQMAAERLAEELEFDEERDPERYAFLELDYYHKDGSIRCLETTLSFIRDEHGKPVGIHGISRDITERKRAEEALRESEEKYRRIYENSVVGFFQSTPEGRFLDVNSAFAKMLGYGSPEELVSSVSDIASQTYANPEDRSRYHNALQAQGYVEDFQLKVRCKDGSKVWLSDSSRAYFYEDGKIVRYEGIVVDITERKRAEEALRESEERYRTILESIADGYYEVDLAGNLSFCNDSVCELLGYSRDELMDMNYRQYTDEHSAAGLFRAFNEVYRTGRSTKVFGWEVIRKDQSRRFVEASVTLMKDGKGNPSGFRGIVRDITDRKTAEEALRASEKNYRDIFENAVMGIFQTTLDGRYLRANPTGAKMYGYESPEDMIHSVTDMSHQIYVHPEDRTRFLEIMKGKGSVEAFESEHYRKDKSKIWTVLHSRPVRDNTGRVLYYETTIEDITERKQAEEERKRLQAQLSQAQKMESIGILAGGIAHNFNNILMGIQGRASLMMMDKAPSGSDYEHLKGIKEYVKDATDLTRDLLGFARGGKYEVKPIDLNALIKHENRMIGRTKKEIHVQGKYAKGLWTAEVDPGQIRQVLMNIYVNAWQAMPGGGDLYVQTENVTLGEEYVKPFAINPGRYVKLSVTDTGIGMDDATKEKIFDPFFSTKDTGQGSGLGLASVYGIIKNHNGFINVYSEKGIGTTFTIYLPASDKEVTEENRETDRHEIQYGSGTVLLVDDEDMIVNVGQKMLERLGYQVLVAKSGWEALDIYNSREKDIDLVILDMIMPGMGGGEAYDRLKEMDWDVRVLLASGYSINGQAKEIMGRGCMGFIQKPFTMEELSRKVKEVFVR